VQNINKLRDRTFTAAECVASPWRETEHYFDVCRVTSGAHIE